MSITDAITRYGKMLGAGLPKRFRLQPALALETGKAVYDVLSRGNFRRAVEFGSGFGISAAFTAAALKDPAILYVLESNTEKIAVAEKALSRLLPPTTFWEIIPGPPSRTADSVLRNLNPVDYVHLDGDGRYEPTLHFFEMAVAVVRPGGIISGCFRGSPSLRDVLKTIRESNRIVREIKLGDRLGFEIN